MSAFGSEIGSNGNVVIVFLDVVHFSKLKERQPETVKSLNESLERALLNNNINQLSGRLPTGALNLAQRIMDFADGQKRGDDGSNQHAVACSAEFVDKLSAHKQEHFGKMFRAQAKHGQPVQVRFYYTEKKDVPKAEEYVAGPIARFKWITEKVENRGLDFYAFAEEKTAHDKERLHKQLVRKNFEFQKRGFQRQDCPSAINFDEKTFRDVEKLDLYPVRLVLGHHPDFGICGPALDTGDLIYGKYEVAFYFSVFDPLPPGVKLSVEVCHGSNNPTRMERCFKDLSGGETRREFSGEEAKLDSYQWKCGWHCQRFVFAYDGEPFVQFRLRLENGHAVFHGKNSVPQLWFYKVNLRLLPSDA